LRWRRFRWRRLRPRRWPDPEDRFASDLLLPATIADPWLRALTESAIASEVPSFWAATRR